MYRSDVVFLIALYRNDADVLAFVRRLAEQTHRDFLVLVVCNESLDEEKFAGIASGIPYVHVLYPKKNLGYLGAAHFALENYRVQFQTPLLTIVCNADLRIQSNDLIEGLLQHATSENVGVVAPSVTSGFSGNDTNPYLSKRYAKNYLKMLKTVYGVYPVYALYESLALVKSKFWIAKKKPVAAPNETYAVYGAFMAFTKPFFERGGTLKYDAFLYGEEIFIGEQCRRLQLKVIHDSRFNVIHDEHSTTGFIKSPRHVTYLHQSIAFNLSRFYDER